MEREKGKIIEPISIEPTTSPIGSDIVIHYRGLTYRYHTDEWNPSLVQIIAWNYLKAILLKGEKL
jgi:hypothetical protein